MSDQDQVEAEPQSNKVYEIEDLSLSAEVAEETKGGKATSYGRHEGAFMGNLFGATPTAK
jgi:hypothetical protein